MSHNLIFSKSDVFTNGAISTPTVKFSKKVVVKTHCAHVQRLNAGWIVIYDANSGTGNIKNALGI